METLPIMLGQMKSVEADSPSPLPTSDEFSNLLTGQGAPNSSGAPPGAETPPGVKTTVEGAEKLEPNAPSHQPDFHPQIETQVFFMPGVPQVSDSDSEESVIDLTKADTDAKTESEDSPSAVPNMAAYVAGALALQNFLPEPPISVDPMFTELTEQGIKSIDNPVGDVNAQRDNVVVFPLNVNSESTESVDDVPPAPMPPLVKKTNPIAMPASVQSPSETDSPASVNVSHNSTKNEVAVTGQSPWNSTYRRGMDDLAFLGKYEDLTQFTASRTESDIIVNNNAMTSAFVDPEESIQLPIPNPAIKDLSQVTRPAPTTPTPVESPAETIVSAGPAVPEGFKATPSTEQAPLKNPTISNPQQTANLSTEQIAVTSAPSTKPEDAKAKPEEATKKADPKLDPEKAQNSSRTVKTESSDSNASLDAKNGETKQSTKSFSGDLELTDKTTKLSSFNNLGNERGVTVEQPKTTGSESVLRTDKTDQSLPAQQTTKVIRQIADRVELAAAASPRNGVTIKLEPKDLGSVTLVVKSVGDQIDAQIAASDQRVRHALETSQSQLAQAMDRRGFSLNNITISDQSSSANYTQLQENARQHGQQQQQARHDQQANGQSLHNGRTSETSTTPRGIEETRDRIRKASGRSLDLWT